MDHPEKWKSLGGIDLESELQQVINLRKWWAANKEAISS